MMKGMPKVLFYAALLALCMLPLEKKRQYLKVQNTILNSLIILFVKIVYTFCILGQRHVDKYSDIQQ